jgi:hypothetical protein
MRDTTVTVHRYRITDPSTGEWVVQLSKASESHISEVGGQIIAHTAEDVPVSALDRRGHFVPSRASIIGTKPSGGTVEVPEVETKFI